MSKLKLYQHQYVKRSLEFMLSLLNDKVSNEVKLQTLRLDDVGYTTVETHVAVTTMLTCAPEYVVANDVVDEVDIQDMVKEFPGKWPEFENPAFRQHAYMKHDPSKVAYYIDLIKCYGQHQDSLGQIWECEIEHSKNRRHLVIPNVATRKAIDAININKVDFRHVSVPGGSLAFSVPLKSGKRHTCLMVSYEHCNWIRIVPGPDIYDTRKKDDVFPFCLDAFEEELTMVGASLDLTDSNSEVISITKELYHTCMRALVYMQVYPDTVKEGPGVRTEVLTTKRKKGKTKHTKHGVIDRGLTLNVRPEHMRNGKTKWVPPHFRTLHHERYRREDPATGELLKVGEEGKVRLVPVSGYATGGRIKHIDKEAIDA